MIESQTTSAKKMRKQGNRWSLEEKDILRTCNGKTAAQATELLPGRNISAIRNMAVVLDVKLSVPNVSDAPDVNYGGNLCLLFASLEDMAKNKLLKNP